MSQLVKNVHGYEVEELKRNNEYQLDHLDLDMKVVEGHI